MQILRRGGGVRQPGPTAASDGRVQQKERGREKSPLAIGEGHQSRGRPPGDRCPTSGQKGRLQLKYHSRSSNGKTDRENAV